MRPGAHELIIGISEDPVFGPAILFGAGGTAVEVIKDTALALPPLDLKLARSLIAETRVAKLLRGYRDLPAVDLDAIAMTLVRVSQLITDFPVISELVDENGQTFIVQLGDVNDEPYPFAYDPYEGTGLRGFLNRLQLHFSIGHAF